MPDPAPDVPLVTAAHMSARFPVVEPAARLGEDGSAAKNVVCSVGATSVVLRDGGYVENTGVLTVEDLLPELRRAIESEKRKLHKEAVDIPIVVVSIDDDPVAEDEDPRLDLVPSALGIAAQAGPGVLTRARAGGSATAATTTSTTSGSARVRTRVPRRRPAGSCPRPRGPRI